MLVWAQLVWTGSECRKGAFASICYYRTADAIGERVQPSTTWYFECGVADVRDELAVPGLESRARLAVLARKGAESFLSKHRRRGVAPPLRHLLDEDQVGRLR